MSERIAVFPGSFDPITKGHEALVKKAIGLFDKIIIAIGVNTTKQYLFDLDTRKTWLENVFSDYGSVEVQTYEGLTVDFCKRVGAKYILRGLRNTNDFVFEQNIAQMNNDMVNDIETVCLFTQKEFSAINSSIVRELIKNNTDVSQFIPSTITIKA